MYMIYCGNKYKKNVSMMINIFWGREIVEEMLRVLKEKDVRTTFFIVGEWGVDNKDMLKQILKDGHELGNHGWSHKDHDKISYDENYEEIKKCHDMIKESTGYEMYLFAPPSGAFNQDTLDAAESLGYKAIMWSVYKDTIDWRDKEEILAYERATKNLLGGDMILMHPQEHTLKALPRIIDEIRNKGFIPTTVTETIADVYFVKVIEKK